MRMLSLVIVGFHLSNHPSALISADSRCMSFLAHHFISESCMRRINGWTLGFLPLPYIRSILDDNINILSLCCLLIDDAIILIRIHHIELNKWIEQWVADYFVLRHDCLISCLIVYTWHVVNNFYFRLIMIMRFLGISCMIAGQRWVYYS